MHWGTFQLADESLDEPPVALAQARVQGGVPAERFFVSRIGETRRLAPMLPAAALPPGEKPTPAASEQRRLQ